MKFGRFCFCALVLIAAIGPAPGVCAQMPEPTEDPAAYGDEETVGTHLSRRLVAHWDFEESLEHLQPIPRNWFRAHEKPGRPRPGFPPWNWSAFDQDAASEGKVSIKLPTRGGSTSLMLASGVIPALPDAEYLITGMVRTDGLVHARARVVAWFLDRNLNEISGTKEQGPLVLTDGSWQPVFFTVTAAEEAAWIQLELQLVQPAVYEDYAPLPFRAQRQDFSGSASFDDVAIFQIPRLDLRTPSPGNIIIEPEPTTLEFVAEDLAGENLIAALKVCDLDGTPVATTEIDFSSGGSTESWTPKLPAYGWYEAELLIRGPSGIIGRATTTFIWAPTRPAIDAATRHQFALQLRRVPYFLGGDFVGLVQRAKAGSILMPVWHEALTASEMDDHISRLGSIADPLLENGIDITFMLPTIPEELARDARLDPSNLFVLMTGEYPQRDKYLNPILSTFGERVRRWQFGRSGTDDAFWHEDLPALASTLKQLLRGLVPRPMLALSWRFEGRIPESVTELDSLTVTAPAAVHPNAIPEYFAEWPSAFETTILLETHDPTVYGTRATAIDLAKRTIMAYANGAQRIMIDKLWSWRESDRNKRMEPGIELAVWRSVISELSGRSIVGELPMPPGCRALIFEGRKPGLIVAWNSWADAEDAVIRAYLTEGAVKSRDLFGNVTTYERSEGIHQIPLSAMPVFIEGIDVELAQFRSRLRIEPNFIAARAQRHYAEIVVENPWPVTITGRIRLGEPEEWSMTPRVSPFTLAPDRSLRLPFEFNFALGEEAGRRTVEAEVELLADRRYPILHIPLPVEIGLETVQIVPSYRIERGKDGALSDLVVALLITNLSDSPITMKAFVQAPQHKSLQAPVSALGPGESVVRQFRLEGAAPTLKGQEVRVGVREQEGTGRLNRTLLIQ